MEFQPQGLTFAAGKRAPLNLRKGRLANTQAGWLNSLASAEVCDPDKSGQAARR